MMSCRQGSDNRILNCSLNWAKAQLCYLVGSRTHVSWERLRTWLFCSYSCINEVGRPRRDGEKWSGATMAMMKFQNPYCGPDVSRRLGGSCRVHCERGRGPPVDPPSTGDGERRPAAKKSASNHRWQKIARPDSAFGGCSRLSAHLKTS
jgi:hypothetical protein